MYYVTYYYFLSTLSWIILYCVILFWEILLLTHTEPDDDETNHVDLVQHLPDHHNTKRLWQHLFDPLEAKMIIPKFQKMLCAGQIIFHLELYVLSLQSKKKTIHTPLFHMCIIATSPPSIGLGNLDHDKWQLVGMHGSLEISEHLKSMTKPTQYLE